MSSAEPVLASPVLAICIPTFNRAPKLSRVLTQLLSILGKSRYAATIEVVVSDNASEDDTPEVIVSFESLFGELVAFRTYRQPTNIGAEGNFKFLYENSIARYTWFCSDDDILVEDEVDRLVADLITWNPEVCLSSFVNRGTTKDQVILSVPDDQLLVRDLDTAVAQMFVLGKISQYVIRRHHLTEEEESISQRAARTTAFWFVAVSLALFVRRDQSLLLRRGVIAHSDVEVMNLRFSPRVYGTLKTAILLALEGQPSFATYNASLADGPFDVSTLVVAFLFRHVIGRITMDDAVAAKDFVFLTQNLRQLIFHSWRNAVKIPFVLALFPILSRVRRSASARRSQSGRKLPHR